MISHELRCVFVHITKTGGTSVEDALWGSDRSLRSPEIFWMGAVRPFWNRHQTGGLQHLLATQLRLEIGKDVWDRYFTFAFVRNPYDRAVSQWLYLRAHPELQQFYGLPADIDFSGYLTCLGRLGTGHHCQSFEQWRWTHLVPAAGHELVDQVARFENLHEDFAAIAERLGVPGLELPHRLRAENRAPYPKYYDDRAQELVARLYAVDLELFEYAFDGT